MTDGGGKMKKDEARFTIRFNAADPRQQKAMNALKAAGRRKASLIADAVNEYLIRHGYDADTPHTPNGAANKIDARGKIPESPVSAKSGEGVSPVPDGDTCAAILDGLSAFRM